MNLVRFESSCRHRICFKSLKILTLFSYFAVVLQADRKRNFDISVMIIGSWKVRLTDWII